MSEPPVTRRRVRPTGHRCTLRRLAVRALSLLRVGLSSRRGTVLVSDYDADGPHALFELRWDRVEVLTPYCWHVFDDWYRVEHALRAAVRRRLLLVPAGLVLLAVSTLLLVTSSSPVLLVVPPLLVAPALLYSHVVWRVRVRRVRSVWDSSPVLGAIEAFGGFAAMPLIWAHNIAAIAMGVDDIEDRSVRTSARRLTSAYREWVAATAGAHVDEAVATMATLAGEFHGSFDELRETVSLLVAEHPLVPGADRSVR